MNRTFEASATAQAGATPGFISKNPSWEILLHVANHPTDHRAQRLVV